MTPSISRAAQVITSRTPALATAGATLLSLDNVLGFIDAHVLHPGWSSGVAAVTVVAGILGVVASSWCRDDVRSLVSMAVVVQVAMLSPATGSAAGWESLDVTARAVVPLCLAAAAVISWRRSLPGMRRAFDALVASLATAWLVGAVAPVMPLELFLGVQVLTLTVSTAVVASGLLHRASAFLRHLWHTSDVR